MIVKKIRFLLLVMLMLPTIVLAEYKMFFAGGLSVPIATVKLVGIPSDSVQYINSSLRFGIQFNRYIEIGAETSKTLWPHVTKSAGDEYDSEAEFSMSYLQLNYPMGKQSSVYAMFGSGKTKFFTYSGLGEPVFTEDKDDVFGAGYEFKTLDDISYTVELLQYYNEKVTGVGESNVRAISLGIKTYF